MTESGSEPVWLSAGTGITPELRWTFTTDASLVEMVLSRESGDIIAADASGGMYKLDRRGRIVAVTRGFTQLGALAVSDTGGVAAAVSGDSTLCCLDDHLNVKWSLDLKDIILNVAVEPFGNHIAASLANGRTHIFKSNKKRFSRFDTVRPLSFMEFVATEPAIVAAADYGLLCSHDLQGEEIWSEQLWSTVGSMAMTGDGEHIYLAGFSHGVQAFDREGANHGSYLVEGAPSQISSSFSYSRLAIATVERHIYWLDADGEMLWASILPEDICRVRCDPVGRGITCGLNSGRLLNLYWGTEN